MKKNVSNNKTNIKKRKEINEKKIKKKEKKIEKKQQKTRERNFRSKGPTRADIAQLPAVDAHIQGNPEGAT
jgi:hypothetical protein